MLVYHAIISLLISHHTMQAAAGSSRAMDSYYSAAVYRSEDDDEIAVFTAERYFSGGDVDVLWCGRSSTSFSSAFKTGGGQQDGSVAPTTLTAAATSSSEASLNSRSVLLPDPPMAAAVVESEVPSGAAGDRTTGAKTSSSSSYNLQRWLLSMAASACACSHGGIAEAVSADECGHDEAHAAGFVLGGEKWTTEEARAALPGRKSKHIAAEAITTRVRPGMWDGRAGDAFDIGTATPPVLQLAEHRHIRAADSGELAARVLNPTTAILADERRRRSMDMFTPGKPQNSAFTIVARSAAARDGSATAGANGGGVGSPNPPPDGACANRRNCSDEDAATDELVCMYPPSEASVAWSVVTAEGAASGNFSSAASGYYHNGGGERWTAAGKSNRRSSGSGKANGGVLLMGCMSERAVDAIVPARPVHCPPPPPETRTARLEGASTLHAAGRRGMPGTVRGSNRPTLGLEAC
ncbi:hypothetical protein GUJ93_ZPchr0005g15100 [Zizania palustris]|uniref:Uncharacterized protein n=1 Tax=Zizania palustris TaxID=103762 RepID=A0A8J5S971_ZIZPA|nr:hypothetical protein GUJ93_ZPchr0005g15100 [Zizania palustris]